MSTFQSLGGKAKANKIRREYLECPNLCLTCEAPILPKEDERLSDTRKKRFCNKSCAATFNNSRSPKRTKTAARSGPCELCGETVTYRERSDGSVLPRRFCNECVGIAIARARCCNYPCHLAERTKGELFSSRKNWQSARSTIQRNGREIYMRSDKQKECLQCGYSRRIDVCHIRDVSDFPDDALLGEINHIDNLIALCKTHHAEFDDGYITL